MSVLDPISMIRPRRRVEGISAILLPFQADGAIDWKAFRDHVGRTSKAGLTPAVNMDTGYVNLLDESTCNRVLVETRETLGNREFVAGAFVGDTPGSTWNRDACLRAVEAIQSHQGTPVIFQTFGLTTQEEPQIVEAYQEVGKSCDRFIAFELGTMFAPFGRIYSLELYRELVAIKPCVGAKHSSLSRELEWERLRIRDAIRPDFRVYTGNDLAIDMIMYGSDYLLGLSTFAPDFFRVRDEMWESGDPTFFEMNDTLQYLGNLAFRNPVPAYKHSAAQFLKLRGWIDTDRTHPGSPSRPASDIPILHDILDRLIKVGGSSLSRI